MSQWSNFHGCQVALRTSHRSHMNTGWQLKKAHLLSTAQRSSFAAIPEQSSFIPRGSGLKRTMSTTMYSGLVVLSSPANPMNCNAALRKWVPARRNQKGTAFPQPFQFLMGSPFTSKPASRRGTVWRICQAYQRCFPPRIMSILFPVLFLLLYFLGPSPYGSYESFRAVMHTCMYMSMCMCMYEHM